MKQYLELADKVMRYGHVRSERTGTGTISVFGPQLVFDLREGFPAVTTKKLAIRLVWTELLWMLSGQSSIKQLLQHNNNIWNEWPFKRWVQSLKIDLNTLTAIEFDKMMAEYKRKVLTDRAFEKEYGDLGPVYGNLWRGWKQYETNTETLYSDDQVVYVNNLLRTTFIDQLQKAIDTIRQNPTDRRMIVTAWDPASVDDVPLPPCHILYQFYVEDDYIDIKVYQRSADVFLGLPFDIACFATLLHMVAHITHKVPRQLIYTLGDTHIYTDHVEQMVTQLQRDPYPLPVLNVNARGHRITRIDDFVLEDLRLDGYRHHPPLKGNVSI